jgi:Putative Flp pilus-assembly TadE/G-like
MGTEMTSQQFVKIRNYQSGQVLIWFLGFAATLSMIFAGVYSIGQATSEKQKIVNAADAAAYSGALTEARALNLASYTNRSVIANEVLIAQMVSLDSWASYFSVATDNYATVFGLLKDIPFPPTVVLFGILETTMRLLHQVVEPIDNTLESVVPATITLWEGIYAVWYTATIKPAFIPPIMAIAATSASESVLANNIANQSGRTDIAPRLAQIGQYQLFNQVEFSRLIKRYEKTGSPGTSSDDRKYAAELLLASRDQFSIERRGSNYPIIKAFFGTSDFCAPFLFVVGSEKLGPTRLVNYDRWEAQDTLEYRSKVPPKFACGWGKGTVAIPTGWGRATADRNSDAGDQILTSGGAGSLAYSNNHANGAWSGVKELYDVERNNNGTPKYEEISYASAVYKQNTDIRNNEALGFMSRPMNATTGSPDLRAGFARNQIGAISEAKVFFARPVRNNRDITAGNLFRADNHQEFASLYNPYWQVRLKDVSVANRALAYAFGGFNPALAIYAQN